MGYTTLDATKPVSTQTGTQAVDSARTNATALRDAILMGAMQGFAFSISGGTAEQPAQMFWKNGTTWLRGTITWGSSGGDVGNMTAITWELSLNSGVAYDAIASETRTYDASGNMTASSNAGGWSAWLGYLLGKVKAVLSSFNTHAAATGTAVHSLGNMSTQTNTAVNIDGGAIDATPIGTTTPNESLFTRASEQFNTYTPGAGAGVTVDWAKGGSTITNSGTNALTFTGITNSPTRISTHLVSVSNFNNTTFPAAVTWGLGGKPSIAGAVVCSLVTYDGGTTVYGAVLWRAV